MNSRIKIYEFGDMLMPPPCSAYPYNNVLFILGTGYRRRLSPVYPDIIYHSLTENLNIVVLSNFSPASNVHCGNSGIFGVLG